MADTEAQPEQEDVEAEEKEELSPLEQPGHGPDPLDVRDIPLSDIAELDNTRPSYHGIEQLAESMHAQGQLMPCLLRPAADDATHGRPFELIFGYRRKRAAEYLAAAGVEGWETLRCEVRDVPADEEIAKMIVENFQREDLSPVAEARAMRDLKRSEDPPLSNVEVARRLGCDPSHVSHRLSLLELALPAIGKTHADRVEGEPVQGSQPAPGSGRQVEIKLDPIGERESEDDGAPSREIGPDPKRKQAADAGEEEAEKPQVDILQMIDAGEISASTGEVIASLPDRDKQEKLALLAKRHQWSTKKAAAWARDAKEHEAQEGGSELGPVQMIEVEDVVDLPRLLLREDLSDLDYKRITVYALLRNGMDRELLEYLDEEMNFPYERLWSYVRTLDEQQLQELERRIGRRYISAAHRYHSLEPSLRDDLGAREQAIPSSDAPLSLPPAGHSEGGEALW